MSTELCAGCDRVVALGAPCDAATCRHRLPGRVFAHEVGFKPHPAIRTADLPKPRTIYDTRVAVDHARDVITAPVVDVEAAQAAVRAMLIALGQDPDREGLVDTPRRVAAMWAEFLAYDPGKLATTFKAEHTDQMVVVSGMRVWSMCEHHLLPFWCDVAVGYIAADQVIGLSKVGRIAHKHAHRLQLQERLVTGIADELAAILGHANVAVLAVGEHLCMTSRGISTPHRMTSSCIRGHFTQADTRAEFLALARG